MVWGLVVWVYVCWQAARRRYRRVLVRDGIWMVLCERHAGERKGLVGGDIFPIYLFERGLEDVWNLQY